MLTTPVYGYQADAAHLKTKQHDAVTPTTRSPQREGFVLNFFKINTEGTFWAEQILPGDRSHRAAQVEGTSNDHLVQPLMRLGTLGETMQNPAQLHLENIQ